MLQDNDVEARMVPDALRRDALRQFVCWLDSLSPSDAATRRCRTCGDTFLTAREQAHWFTRKGLSQPRRCEACRRAS